MDNSDYNKVSKLSAQKEIFHTLRKRGALTRQQLVKETGYPINIICGRVNELIRAGTITVDGYHLHEVEGRTYKRQLLRIIQ